MTTPERPNELNPIIRWRQSPLTFVVEAIGATPTNQQTEALLLLGELYEAKLRSSWGAPLTKRQEELSKKFGITIVSGHGTGKDSFLAWVYLWLIVCFKEPRGIVTAPTDTQLKSVLWPEINLWLKRSRGELHRYVDIQSDILFKKDDKKNSFVIKRTANVKGSEEEQGEALQGPHADFLILAVDEASGVPNGVYKPIEGMLTGLFNIVILLANPTRSSGYFFDTHNSQRALWCPLWWDCESSNMDEVRGNNAMAMYVERMATKYGRESSFYKMRVRGLFPSADPDALIPLEWVMGAVGRDVEPVEGQGVVLGVDVARYGPDKSIIMVRRGPQVEAIEEFNQINTMELAGWVSAAMADWKPAATFVDVIGVGAGVVDRLMELGKPNVFGVNVSESPSRDDKYIRLRDELWWRTRELFEHGKISIPNDEELIGELSSIRYKVQDSRGRVKVETKAEIKKRRPFSPNKADALMLSTYFQDSTMREEEAQDAYEEEEEEPVKGSWMGA